MASREKFVPLKTTLVNTKESFKKLAFGQLPHSQQQA
jgi:hypothetical protein